MKSVRILFIVFIFVVSLLSLFSCMKDDDYKPVGHGYVTVEDGYLGVGKRLLVDNSDIVLIPSASSLLQYNNLEGIERLYAYFTIQDDVVIEETDTQWPIDLIGGTIIPTKYFSNRPDTLSNDSINEFTRMWTTYKHVNIELITSPTAAGGNMVQEKVSNDTVYLKLYYGYNTGFTPYATGASFRMPGKYEFEQAGLEMTSDSIVVAVSAKVKDGSSSKTVTKYAKYKPN